MSLSYKVFNQHEGSPCGLNMLQSKIVPASILWSENQIIQWAHFSFLLSCIYVLGLRVVRRLRFVGEFWLCLMSQTESRGLSTMSQIVLMFTYGKHPPKHCHTFWECIQYKQTFPKCTLVIWQNSKKRYICNNKGTRKNKPNKHEILLRCKAELPKSSWEESN